MLVRRGVARARRGGTGCSWKTPSSTRKRLLSDEMIFLPCHATRATPSGTITSSKQLYIYYTKFSCDFCLRKKVS